jgi:MFS transporter, DHA1 family, multidrug resistance protein
MNTQTKIELPLFTLLLMISFAEEYGFANLLPPIGLFFGSFCSARLAKNHSPTFTVRLGMLISMTGIVLMFITLLLKLSILFFLFLPMIVIYFGLALIPANVTNMAMKTIPDKANASAVMSFTNMGLATLVALNVSLLPVTTWVLPVAFFILCAFMMGMYQWVIRSTSQ